MNDILIDLEVDKKPYIKNLTDDKIINLTGESGSGKTFYTNQFKNDENYIIIDTDEIFARFENSNGINKELGIMFRNKYNKLPDICEKFDLIYKDILDFFKDTDKTIIIDSAQFRNIKDYSLLKGKVIIMRTSINNCYERCIKRWMENRNNNFTEEELEEYKNKKYGMFSWYKSLNNFLSYIDQMK